MGQIAAIRRPPSRSICAIAERTGESKKNGSRTSVEAWKSQDGNSTTSHAQCEMKNRKQPVTGGYLPGGRACTAGVEDGAGRRQRARGYGGRSRNAAHEYEYEYNFYNSCRRAKRGC